MPVPESHSPSSDRPGHEWSGLIFQLQVKSFRPAIPAMIRLMQTRRMSVAGSVLLVQCCWFTKEGDAQQCCWFTKEGDAQQRRPDRANPGPDGIGCADR